MGIFRNPAVLITLILLVVLLFGAKRLPDVARSVGSSLKIFKKEIKDLGDDDSASTSERPASNANAEPKDEARAAEPQGASGAGAGTEPPQSGPADPKHT